ncbi:MAG: GatB/YqeY domain-containing protein [Oligoflexia bacterium]|nr:GatB/YqeY domain-containing protein [Oligoflexia bacterium]
MALKAQLSEDLKASMKGGDKVKLGVIRMIQSAVKNKEIDERVKPQDPNDKRTADQKEDELIQAVLKTMAKQRRESIEQFKAGGRQDLVDQETAELKVIESYLPQQLPRDQVEAIVAEVIKSTGASGPKEMGNVMKAVLAKVAGKADNKLVSEIVKAKLQ